MTATIDEVAKTLADFEVLAQKTGEWDGAEPVEFSRDGITWLPVWVARDGETFPPFARATVRRKGVATPTTMVVAWDESVPADEDWRQLWERKPMKLFGSFALRSAIRHAFRDAVGELRGPDENDTDGPAPWDRPADRTDWDTQLADAPDVAALDMVWKDMRTARERTAAREVVYKSRRTLLVDAAWTAESAPEAERDAARVLTVAADIAPVVDEAIAEATAQEKPRPKPQDHLPSNRAERRAAARKKGRRK